MANDVKLGNSFRRDHSQQKSDENAHSENQAENPASNWRNVFVGAFHDLLRWSFIPNFVVGFAFLFICIGAALFVKTQRGGLLCIAFGITIIFWILVIAIYQRLESPADVSERVPPSEGRGQPQFSVTLEFAMPTNGRSMNSSWWYVHDHGTLGVIASPISDLLYIGLTNLDRSTLMIESYAVEVRKEGMNWQQVTRMDGRTGQLFNFVSADPKKATQIILPEIFDVAINNKNIATHDTIRGWVFLERPAGYEGRLDWRFRIMDNVHDDESICPVTYKRTSQGHSLLRT